MNFGGVVKKRRGGRVGMVGVENSLVAVHGPHRPVTQLLWSSGRATGFEFPQNPSFSIFRKYICSSDSMPEVSTSIFFPPAT